MIIVGRIFITIIMFLLVIRARNMYKTGECTPDCKKSTVTTLAFAITALFFVKEAFVFLGVAIIMNIVTSIIFKTGFTEGGGYYGD